VLLVATIALVLAASALLLARPIAAFGAEYTFGDFIVTADSASGLSTTGSGADTVLVVGTGNPVTIRTLSNPSYPSANNASATTNRISVALSSTQAANITLAGVRIDGGSANAAGLVCGGQVTNLTLADGSTNWVRGGEGYGAIQISNGVSVSIGGTGTLTAITRGSAAAIGNTYNGTKAGDITITGGTITAYCDGMYGTGIGAGSNVSATAAGTAAVGTIRILGGNVLAYAATGLTSAYGAGIGAGYVKATDSGINKACVDAIIIQNATVHAYASQGSGAAYAAAIGSAPSDSANGSCVPHISIQESTVTAIASANSGYAFGAGIGAGKSGSRWSGGTRIETITITDSTVTAAAAGSGVSYAAGIGTGLGPETTGIGNMSTVETITISGGNVTAYSSATNTAYGAGIGAGFGQSTLSSAVHRAIVISDGARVTAYASDTGAAYAAGIGAGYGSIVRSSAVGDIRITDSSVTAYARRASTGTAKAYGAAIGGGYGANIESSRVGDITLTNSNVTARAAVTGVSYGAGIGAGYGSDTYAATTGDITINGGTVVANSSQRGRAYGAAIGGGYGRMATAGTTGDITINGGTITAIASESGAAESAGIGAGNLNGRTGDITITGGTIRAIGSVDGYSNAAGIGASRTAPVGTITISGGTVYADSSVNAEENAPAIGDGYNYEAAARAEGVRITGGSVQVGTAFGAPYNITPTPVDAQDRELVPATFTLGNAGESDVVSLSSGSIYGVATQNVAAPTGDAYNLHDVKTDATGTVFFWLPAHAQQGTVALSTANGDYSRDFRLPAPAGIQAQLTAGGGALPDSATGIFTVSTQGDIGRDYSYNNGILSVLTTMPIQIATTGSAVHDNAAIIVDLADDDATADVTLNGVRLENHSSIWGSALTVLSGNLKLTLAADSTNTLRAGQIMSGITLADGADLTINGTGNVEAGSGQIPGPDRQSFADGAGIGSVGVTAPNARGRYGGQDEAGGDITLDNGTVTAYSARNGAGYGAGIGASGYAPVGTITINGGDVTAFCTDYPDHFADAAGIGGSSESTAGDITINGGTVLAWAGLNQADGAGIGAGCYDTVGTITINGGNVQAYSILGTGDESQRYGGAGIGAVYRMESDVRINGGTVTAGVIRNAVLPVQTNAVGAAIGAGNEDDSLPENVTAHVIIRGGSVRTVNGDAEFADTGYVFPQPTDGEHAVYLATLTLGDPDIGEGRPVTAGRIDGVPAVAASEGVGVTGVVYGIRDVVTADNGRVYFWLADTDSTETTVVLQTAGTSAYRNSFARVANSQPGTVQTLYSVPNPTTLLYVGGTEVPAGNHYVTHDGRVSFDTTAVTDYRVYYKLTSGSGLGLLAAESDEAYFDADSAPELPVGTWTVTWRTEGSELNHEGAKSAVITVLAAGDDDHGSSSGDDGTGGSAATDRPQSGGTAGSGTGSGSGTNAADSAGSTTGTTGTTAGGQSGRTQPADLGVQAGEAFAWGAVAAVLLAAAATVVVLHRRRQAQPADSDGSDGSAD
jgi:hypothetical protein